MNDEKVVSKMSGIVPEMWHDLIARITPGMVIVYASIASVPGALGEITGGGFAALLVLAYLVGLVVDLVSGWSEIILKPLAELPKLGWLESFSLANYTDVDQLRSPARELMVKMFAEVVLCRSLFFYACAHLIASVARKGGFTVEILETAFAWVPACPSWEVALLATIVMGLCWWRIGRGSQGRFKELLGSHPQQFE